VTFPWETPTLAPVEFVCKHCKNVQPQVQGRLIVCTCPGALKEQAEERQRIENWKRQQASTIPATRNRRQR
jgi:hypothetical protein